MSRRQRLAAVWMLATLAVAVSVGSVTAVASRTSDGFVATASQAPAESAGPGIAAPAARVSGPADDSAPLTVMLWLVAAAGFGRGAWLLRRPRAKAATRPR